jgi:pimeloyl-ACP methyl ester carboxylesterase
VSVVRYPPRNRLQLNGRSYVLWPSEDPCTTAIVFVHGFKGCCEKTWLQFQTLPDRLGDSWWRTCDLVFYSYDSTGTQIWPNASLLDGFLRDLFPIPKWPKLGSNETGPFREYRSIVLVGHSEGAVLLRGAILERAQSHLSAATAEPREQLRSDELLRADLCLFAPALFGSLICGWKGVLLRSPVLGDLVETCLNKSPAYKQLKENSPILEQIRTDTIEFAKKFPELAAFKARSLFGSRDCVVSIASLATDFPSEYDAEKNHISICKPSTMYLRPLTFIRDQKYAVDAA